jgi:hypothetical protein
LSPSASAALRERRERRANGMTAAVGLLAGRRGRSRLILVDRDSVGSRRWLWFIAWGLAGACFGLSISALAIFTLPLGILAVLVLRRRSGGREALGLLAGFGVVMGAVGSIHMHYQACSATGGSLFLRVGQTHVGSSCGGVDGIPWLIDGVVLVATAAILYLLASRRSSSHGSAVAPMVG